LEAAPGDKSRDIIRREISMGLADSKGDFFSPSSTLDKRSTGFIKDNGPNVWSILISMDCNILARRWGSGKTIIRKGEN